MTELPLHTSRDMRPEALEEYGPGLYFLDRGFQEVHTPAGVNAWSVDHALTVWLMQGGTGVARAQSVVARDEADDELQRLLAEIDPWVSAIAVLARADRRAAEHDRLVRLRGETERDTPQDEIDWMLDRYPGLLDAEERKIWWAYLPKIDAGLAMMADAIRTELIDLRAQAAAALPSGLPTTPDSWIVPGTAGPFPTTWTPLLTKLRATSWAAARDEVEETRGPLARWAVASGMSKAQLHQLTGMSRATIDRYLAQP
ncbi:hypothetical protein [Kitasatospora indigofera]|uniref:hypothetical protein n=1 Tax=Kitasatospora indigofera TaxID=67307 RepID=UPI0036AD6079